MKATSTLEELIENYQGPPDLLAELLDWEGGIDFAKLIHDFQDRPDLLAVVLELMTIEESIAYVRSQANQTPDMQARSSNGCEEVSLGTVGIIDDLLTERAGELVRRGALQVRFLGVIDFVLEYGLVLLGRFGSFDGLSINIRNRLEWEAWRCFLNAHVVERQPRSAGLWVAIKHVVHFYLNEVVDLQTRTYVANLIERGKQLEDSRIEEAIGLGALAFVYSQHQDWPKTSVPRTCEEFGLELDQVLLHEASRFGLFLDRLDHVVTRDVTETVESAASCDHASGFETTRLGKLARKERTSPLQNTSLRQVVLLSIAELRKRLRRAKSKSLPRGWRERFPFPTSLDDGRFFAWAAELSLRQRKALVDEILNWKRQQFERPQERRPTVRKQRVIMISTAVRASAGTTHDADFHKLQGKARRILNRLASTLKSSLEVLRRGIPGWQLYASAICVVVIAVGTSSLVGRFSTGGSAGGWHRVEPPTTQGIPDWPSSDASAQETPEPQDKAVAPVEPLASGHERGSVSSRSGREILTGNGAPLYKAPREDSLEVGKLNPGDYIIADASAVMTTTNSTLRPAELLSGEQIEELFIRQKYREEAMRVYFDPSQVERVKPPSWAEGSSVIGRKGTVDLFDSPHFTAKVVGYIQPGETKRITASAPIFSDDLYWIAIDNGGGVTVYAKASDIRPDVEN